MRQSRLRVKVARINHSPLAIAADFLWRAATGAARA